VPSGCIRTPRNGNPETLRDFFRRAFVAACDGCNIQSDQGEGMADGWPCRTCFFDVCERIGITDDEAHALWLIQLRMRGNGSRDDDMYKITIVKLPKAIQHAERMRRHQEGDFFHD
jgi:hypothetical protein